MSCLWPREARAPWWWLDAIRDEMKGLHLSRVGSQSGQYPQSSDDESLPTKT